jgi:hypothetical protein
MTGAITELQQFQNMSIALGGIAGGFFVFAYIAWAFLEKAWEEIRTLKQELRTYRREDQSFEQAGNSLNREFEDAFHRIRHHSYAE